MFKRLIRKVFSSIFWGPLFIVFLIMEADSLFSYYSEGRWAPNIGRGWYIPLVLILGLLWISCRSELSRLQEEDHDAKPKVGSEDVRASDETQEG